MSSVTDPKGGLISIAARLVMCKALDRLNEVCENQETISTKKLQTIVDEAEDCLKREAIRIRNMAMAITVPAESKPCASCGIEQPASEMKVCMDSRQMHRYVCDSKCMIEFYK